MYVPVLKCHQLQGALPPPLTPYRGLCPIDPAGGSAPDPRYRLALPHSPYCGLSPPQYYFLPPPLVCRRKVHYSHCITYIRARQNRLHKDRANTRFTLVRSCGCACFRFTDLLLIGGTSLSMAYHALITTISNSNDELHQHCTAYTSRWHNKIYRTLSNKIYSQKSRDSYFIILI